MVCIGALAFFVFCYQLTRFNDQSVATTGALLCAMLAGACVGFLPHNFNPARVFMGDSGSMLIGLVLSASAITLTGQFSTKDLSKGAMGTQASFLVTLLPVLLPLAILVVPLADLVLAVLRRTRAGRSPFAPGQAAPAPPAAGDRALAAPGRADHVDVGGADRLRHGARQPLHRPADVGLAGHDVRAHRGC